MMSDVIEEIKMNVFTSQSEIIRLQGEVIDELFSLLSQHAAVGELDHLPCITKINKAAMLKRELEL